VLARKTVWEEIAPDTYMGLGQRVMATDIDDIPLMDVRSVALTPDGGDEEAAPPADDHA
jgi:type VI secretion system protein ImpE